MANGVEFASPRPFCIREFLQASKLSPEAIEHFLCLAENDAAVHAAVQAARHGGFGSVEQMLFCLVNCLAEQRKTLANSLMDYEVKRTAELIVEKWKGGDRVE